MGDMRILSMSPLSEKSGSPVSQQSRSPTNQQFGSPVHEQPGPQAKQQLGSPMNQQPGSLVHQQPESPEKQQTPSSFEKQDEQTPFSPTSSIETVPSPASVDHGSPADNKAAKRNKISQEYNEQETKNESLKEEQINLLRQKREVKKKVKLLSKMMDSMTHCMSCVDDNVKNLIKEGDYSIDISLDKNTLRSSNSQNGLVKESLEDVVCCTADGPVADLLTPSNSMTNPGICGDFTLEFLCSELTEIRNSFENPDGIMTTYDVTERHEWPGPISDTQNINPSNSQKIREIKKIAADLEADVNARFPKKRRNSSEDANENCIKNTKQDHRTAISTSLREKNGQENFSITEEKPIRRIIVKGRAAKNHVIAKEVCKKLNEEKTAMSCSTESTFETSDNETAVKSEVESLSEKFTSAVSFTNTEDRNLATIITVKDMKYSAQSGHGVMPEVKESGCTETQGLKDVKESLTETDSIARTEDDTNVNLLEKSLKTLSICDKSKTEGAVNTANKQIEEVGLIKDAQESFASSKNESYNTDDSALAKMNCENLHMNNEQEDQSHKVHKLNNNNSNMSESSMKKHVRANRPNKNGDAQTEAKKTGKISFVNMISKLSRKFFSHD